MCIDMTHHRKAPSGLIVYTRTPKVSWGKPFKAHVYTIQLDGVMELDQAMESSAARLDTQEELLHLARQVALWISFALQQTSSRFGKKRSLSQGSLFFSDLCYLHVPYLLPDTDSRESSHVDTCYEVDQNIPRSRRTLSCSIVTHRSLHIQLAS